MNRKAEQNIEKYVEKITGHIADLPVDQREARLMNLIIALCEQLLNIVPPAIGVPGMLFQQCLYYRNSPRAFIFKNPVGDGAGHHVRGGVPSGDLQRHGYGGQDGGNG